MAKKTLLEMEFPLDTPYELEGIPEFEEFIDLLDEKKLVKERSGVGVIRAGANFYGTWGLIYVWNGSKWTHKGYTLEPKPTAGKGPIPIGTYRFRKYMSSRLGKTLRLFNVPGFTNILVHVGNVQKETVGCILAAKQVDHKKTPTRLIDSRTLTNWLYDNCAEGTIQIVSS